MAKIDAVKREISIREELLRLQEQKGIGSGSTIRRLKELRKTLIQLECNHVTRYGLGIICNYCPECGKPLLIGG